MFTCYKMCNGFKCSGDVIVCRRLANNNPWEELSDIDEASAGGIKTMNLSKNFLKINCLSALLHRYPICLDPTDVVSMILLFIFLRKRELFLC